MPKLVAPLPQANFLSEIVTPLLRWYDAERRILPWREDPTPYHVLVSEIMLQQTRVETVKKYYERFLQKLPTLEALAQADEATVFKLWEGLGYYRRARHLRLASQVAWARYHGLPSDFASLLALPGLGRYTAGAIASIAFQQRVCALDANALRVLARLLDIAEDVTRDKIKRVLEVSLRPALPSQRIGDFNQAIIELGALVCLPQKSARCTQCPLQSFCLAFRNHTVADLPVKPSKHARRVERVTFFVLQQEGRLALTKRPPQGLLAGLWGLPMLKRRLTPTAVIMRLQKAGLQVQSLRALPPTRHIFTHLEWDIQAWEANVQGTNKNLVWTTLAEREATYSIPSAFAFYCKASSHDVSKGEVS